MSELAKPCILLVEDEFIILEVLEQELLEAGFDVVVVSSGDEALSELDKALPQFDCVVTDIDLGKGANGWEVARRARELSHATVIIYMSGRRAVDWAVDGVPESIMLHKPFAAVQLTTAISTKLNDAQRIAQLSPPTAEG